MAGRKVRDEAEARRYLAAAESSGLPLAEWARAEGIDGRSLNMWRLNLSRVGAEEPAPRLVELVPRATRGRTFVVRCGPFAVDVGADFDQDTLHRILEVVAAC